MKTTILSTMLVVALSVGGMLMAFPKSAQADFSFSFGRPSYQQPRYHWARHQHNRIPWGDVTVVIGGRPYYYYNGLYYPQYPQGYVIQREVPNNCYYGY